MWQIFLRYFEPSTFPLMSFAHFSEMLWFDTLFKFILLCQNTLTVKEAKIILTASVSHRNKTVNKSHESILLYIVFVSGKQKSNKSKNFPKLLPHLYIQ